MSFLESALSSSDTASRPRGYSDGELIADATVHAAAIVAGVIGFSVLFQKVAAHGAVGDGLAMAVYAAGFFLLFGFSCAYNMAPPSPAKAILRRSMRPGRSSFTEAPASAAIQIASAAIQIATASATTASEPRACD